MDSEYGTAPLTPREREVARAYAAGGTYRDVAARLGIAPSTVRAHVGAVYAKLGVSSKIALLRAMGADHAPAGPSGHSQRPSVVVLPFDDRSDAPGQAFLAEGLVEGVTASLSRFRSLFVISRSSTLAWRHAAPDVRAVARELGVRYAVTGSLSRSGGRLRVAAELVDAETGGQVWMQRFDRVPADLFELLDELTRTIVAAIAPEVEAHEIERARRRPTRDLTAWELCCRGLQDFPGPDAAKLAAARGWFEQAIAADPGFAAARAHLARTHFYEVISGFSPDPTTSIGLGLAQARAALAIDDREDAAYLSLGYCLALARQYDEAIAALDYGLQLNPNNCNLYNARAFARFFAPDGDFQQVIADETTALSLSPNDPLRWTAQATIGWSLLADEAGAKPDAALAMLRKAGTMASADWHVHVGIAIACIAGGDVAAAAAPVAEARRRREGLSTGLIAATLSPLFAKSPRLAAWAARLTEAGMPAG